MDEPRDKSFWPRSSTTKQWYRNTSNAQWFPVERLDEFPGWIIESRVTRRNHAPLGSWSFLLLIRESAWEGIDEIEFHRRRNLMKKNKLAGRRRFAENIWSWRRLCIERHGDPSTYDKIDAWTCIQNDHSHRRSTLRAEIC